MAKNAVEQTGLIPRSIIRTFDRFRKQLFPEAENLIIQEFRISRYQFLVSIKCFISLILIPLIVNFLLKNFLLIPITETFWNKKQSEIFLNAYQQEQAFTELKKFQEKLYFEYLLNNPVSFSAEFQQKKKSLLQPIIQNSQTFQKLHEQNFLDCQMHLSETNVLQKKKTDFVAEAKQKKFPVLFQHIPLLQLNCRVGSNSWINTTKIHASLAMPGQNEKMIVQQQSFTTKIPAFCLAKKNIKLTNVFYLKPTTNSLEFPLVFSNNYKDSAKTVSNLPSFALINQFKKTELCSNLSIRNQFFLDMQKFKNKTLNTDFNTNNFRILKSKEPISEDTIKLLIKNKIVELAVYYNHQSIVALTNLIGDFITFLIVSLILIYMKPQISILKSFLTESIYSLNDTKKSFLLILGTDLLVGFHSPRGWEICLELILRHFGFPENKDFAFLFVASFPVLLDTVFKYWIFRYLNKISPSTVATYHNMIE